MLVYQVELNLGDSISRCFKVSRGLSVDNRM